jgi:hypothetical protein
MIGLMSTMVRVSSQTRDGGRRPTVPGQQRPATVNQQKPAQQPPIPKPTAEWLLAAPNPLNVAAIPAQPNSVSFAVMRASGGELTTKGPDGTRFTLTVPPNAVAKNVMITMVPVVAIENLPLSGGLVAAVQITPDDVQFYKNATLLIEPPQPIAAREQTSFASFAYYSDGREFHLYPMETDPSRIALKLVRLGGYGVARGTKVEQDAVRARVPTDPHDRLLMQMQKALGLIRERRLLAARVSFDAAFDRGLLRIIPASFDPGGVLQASAVEGVSAFVKDLEVKAGELYDQLIMPGLRNARPACTPDGQERLAKVISNALDWVREVQLLGLTSRSDDVNMSATGLSDAEVIERHRQRLRDEGWSDEEMQTMDASADEYRQKVQAITDAVIKLIKEAFDKTHQCCIQEQVPDRRYPSQLLGMARQAALFFEGDSTTLLGRNYMEKVEQCACAVGGEGWRGIISYSRIASNMNWKKSETYEFIATGLGHQGRDATGDVQFHGLNKDRCPKGQIVTTNKASGIDLKAEVSVAFQPEGTYTVFFNTKEPVVGTRVEEHSCATGAGTKTDKHILNHKGQVTGKADPNAPNLIVGTKEESRAEASTGNMKLLVNWRLTRCKSPKKLLP